MIKLNRQVESLEKVQQKIKDRMEVIQNKIWWTEEFAEEHFRDLNEEDQDIINDCNKRMEEFQREYDKIQEAIDILTDYFDFED